MKRLLPFLLAAVITGGTMADAAAAGSIALSVGFDSRKMTREQAARKAVEAMSKESKFPFAEVTKDGNARGWNDKVSVQVLSFRMPDADRVFVVVLAAAAVVDDAERVRDLVRSHVLDGQYDPDSPDRVVTESGKVPDCPYELTWKTADRGAVNLLRLFDAAAVITMEKKGYQTRQAPGKVLAFSSTRSAFAFLSPTTTTTLVGLNVVVATQGEDSGEKVAGELLKGIIKVLFE